MKRLLCLLVILLLPVNALAETLRDRTGAPGHIADTLTSRTGKTIITIDADVIVPDVATAPLWKVSSTYIPAEKIFEIAKLISPDAAIEQHVRHSYDDVGREVHPEAVQGDYSLAHLLATGVTAASLDFDSSYVNGRLLKGEASYWLHDRQQVYFWVEMHLENNRAGVSYSELNGMNLDIPDGDIYGNALSGLEAAIKADAFVASFAPGFTRRHIGSVEGVVMSQSMFINDGDVWNEYAKLDLPSSVPNSYEITYTREIDGIPVNWSISNLRQSKTYENYGWPPGYESIYIVFDDLGEIVNVVWKSPYNIDAKAADDCELMPFKEIWQIFSETVPLTMMYAESKGEIRGSVDHIELGYMPVRQQDGSYLLTPVWDFYGDNLRFTTPYNWAGNTILTIDATNGQVIDRYDGY